MKLRMFGVMALAAVMVSPLFADDEATPKKKRRNADGARRNVAAQLIKQLDAVQLTDEQKTKIKELGTKATEEMTTLRTSAGITPELQKKRADVVKSMKDSELKGKQRAAAINEKAGFTEKHAEAIAKITVVRTKFHKDVVALLSDEQKENLPQQLKRAANAGVKGKKAKAGQAKKNKDAA